jgi:Rieske Fe-S protein
VSSSGAPTPTPTPSAAGIAAAEIPVGGGQIYTDRGVVVTQPTAGEFRAFDIVCPHQGCFVGEVSEGRITCPCHGSQFAIADGSVLRGPVTGQPLTRGLTPKTATLEGDVVVVS